MFTSYRLLNEKKINFAFNRGRYHGYRSCDAKFQCARLQICSSTCRLSPPQTPWSPPGYPGYACVVVGRNNSLLYTAPKNIRLSSNMSQTRVDSTSTCNVLSSHNETFIQFLRRDRNQHTRELMAGTVQIGLCKRQLLLRYSQGHSPDIWFRGCIFHLHTQLRSGHR